MCVSDLAGTAVNPAKAGIQAPSPRRRGSSSFNGSRASLATQKHNCGWLRPCALGYFLCSCKESNQRKHAPGWRDNPIASRLTLERSPDSTSLCWRATGAIPRAALRALGRSAARRGTPYGVLKTPPRTGLRWVAQIPVGASRAPSQAGRCRETFDRARGACFAPGELGERPAAARRAGDRVVFTRRSDRGGFLFVTFLCPPKEKSPAVGQPPTSMRRRR